MNARPEPYFRVEVLALAAGSSMLLGVGGRAQHFFVSLVTSDDASIYGSVLGDDFQKFPTYTEWLAETALSPFILVGGLVLLALARVRGHPAIFVRTLVVVSAGCMLIDAIANVATGEFRTQVWLEAVAANAIGGLLLATYCVNAASFSRQVTRSPHASATLVLVIGVALHALAFVAGTLLLRVTPTPFKVEFRPDFSGSFSTGNLGSDAFRLIPKNESTSGRVHWLGRPHDFRLEWATKQGSVCTFRYQL